MYYIKTYTQLGRLWTLYYTYQHMQQLLHLIKGGNWRYGSKTWILPNEGEEDYIESLDFGWVLGLNGTSNTGVELQLKNSSNEANQKWSRGFFGDDGYFTIKSSSNDMFLSIDYNGNPFIEGKSINLK